MTTYTVSRRWQTKDVLAIVDGETPAEAYAAYAAGCEDDPLDDTDVVIAEAARCACGEVDGERCEWIGAKADTVVVEVMPEWLRASHEAAGNSGVYPHNGAIRIRVERSCADRLVESEDGWASIL